MFLCQRWTGSLLRPGSPFRQTPLSGSERRTPARLALLLSATALLLGQTAPSNASFIAARSYATGTHSLSVAVGDFNGDGLLDAAVVGSSGLSLLLGNGDGSVQPAVIATLDSAAMAVVTGDFNGDGKLDLAVVTVGDPFHGIAGTLHVLLGNGDGSFVDAQTYPAGLSPTSVAVGDFNGDGILDLAVANSEIDILLGNGAGSFQHAGSYPAGSMPSAVAVGDFNGDGLLDLAVSNSRDGTVSLLLGNGDGSFQAAQNAVVGGSPTSVAVADFNGDGLLDLAVANQGLVILLGNGDGSFQPARSYPAGSSVTAVAVGDFNGDGSADLVVTNTFSSTVSLLLGNGDGTFQPFSSYVTGASPVALALADFNHDGLVDLVVVGQGTPAQNSKDGSLNLLLGKGNGSFLAAANYALPDSANQVAVGDFNGDGILDLVVANGQANSVRLLLGNGDGSFRPAPSSVSATNPTSVAVGDFNGDGLADLAVAEHVGLNGGAVSIWLGNGDGTFRLAQREVLGAYFVTTADLNGDGFLDLIVAEGPMSVQLGNVRVLLGNGDGSFQPAQKYAVGVGPDCVAVGDFNGDGIPDLAVSNFTDLLPQASVSILLGNGDGTFQPGQSYTVSAFPTSIAAGKFRGDGPLDLVVAGAGTLSILRGNGDGTFQPAQMDAFGHGATSIVVVDVNGDGIPDLAVSDGTSPPLGAAGNLVSVLLGQGDGSFVLTQSYAAGADPIFVTAGDFNGDGYPDLVVVNNFPSSGVTIFLNAADW